jgi:hypothetical protein
MRVLALWLLPTLSQRVGVSAWAKRQYVGFFLLFKLNDYCLLQLLCSCRWTALLARPI